MNLKTILAGAAASLLLFTACGGGDTTGKSIKDAGVKSAADSLSYYTGMAASQYYEQMAQNDSTLKTPEGKKEFLKGVAAAMGLFEGKSEAEQSGMIVGIQMAMQAQQTNKEFGVKCSLPLMQTGLAFAVNGDSINAAEAMRYVQNSYQKYTLQKNEKDTKAALGNLNKLASQGFKKVQGGALMKVVKPGTGAELKAGEIMEIKASVKTADGKTVERLPMPDKMAVGQTFGKTPLSAAIDMMKVGEKADIAVTAAEMFQGNQSQLGLADDAVLIFTIEIVGPAKVEAASAPAPAAKPDLEGVRKAGEATVGAK